jgi:galactonate dehydratase
MKITALETLKVPPSWVWLKIHTDAGLVGLGEPYLENHPDSVIAEVRRLEPRLIGRDPLQIEALWRDMYEGGSGYKGGPVKMSAISGIDIALWDVAGKAAGVPIHRLLGGACRDRVRMYRSCGGALPYCVEPGQPYRELDAQDYRDWIVLEAASPNDPIVDARANRAFARALYPD